jgi:methylmalonyl-CoA mutase N-terminal domain/subunit
VIEYLTDEIERQAVAYIEKIDELGGTLVSIEQGYIQQEIAEAAYRYQKEVDGQDRIIVGVNEFCMDEGAVSLERLLVDPAIEAQQRQRLADLRARRETARSSAILSRIEQAARSPSEPLMDHFVAAVEADCTLGEICDVLRRVWGEYRPRTNI